MKSTKVLKLDGRNNFLVLTTTAPKWLVCWLILELQFAATITQNYFGRSKKTAIIRTILTTTVAYDNINNNKNIINRNIRDDIVTNNLIVNNNSLLETGIPVKFDHRTIKKKNKTELVNGLVLLKSQNIIVSDPRIVTARSGRSTQTFVQQEEQEIQEERRAVVTLSTSTEGCCSEVTLPGPMTPHTPPVEALPGLAVLVLVVAVVLATLGLVTCVVSHYRAGGGGLGGRARSWHSEHPPPGPAPTAPMLALQPGMERLSHELRDRQVRLHSVSTDLELDLPPNIALPDGEEIPYGSSTRLQIRDPEQESEIYQKCIRPPPNRTVFDGESPPPYRSSSAGLLALGSSSGGSDWSSSSSVTHVVRCHSLSSGGGSTVRHHHHHHHHQHHHMPTVIVPARTRRLSAFSDPPVSAPALAGLTMLPCQTEGGSAAISNPTTTTTNSSGPTGSGGPV